MVYSVLGAVYLELWLLQWPCLSGMVDLTCEAVDDTAQVCVACFGFRNMPRRVGQTPQIEYTTKSKRRPKDFLKN